VVELLPQRACARVRLERLQSEGRSASAESRAAMTAQAQPVELLRIHAVQEDQEFLRTRCGPRRILCRSLQCLPADIDVAATEFVARYTAMNYCVVVVLLHRRLRGDVRSAEAAARRLRTTRLMDYGLLLSLVTGSPSAPWPARIEQLPESSSSSSHRARRPARHGRRKQRRAGEAVSRRVC
jgi:hypothetical protein